MSDPTFDTLMRQGKVAEALERAKARLAEARAGHDDGGAAEALLDEARAQWLKGDRDDAVMTVDEAISAARGAWGPRDPRVAEAFELGAEVAAGSDMPHSAEARFKAAVEILVEAGVSGYPLGNALYHHGCFRRDEGDLEGAARGFLAAVDAVRDADDPEGRALHPTALTALAQLALAAGRQDEARELADGALERWVALGQARRVEVADALSVVGVAALGAGESARAAHFLETACEIYRGCKGDVRASLAAAEGAWGEALAALGRRDDARASLERAFALYREGSPERVLIEERLLELART